MSTAFAHTPPSPVEAAMLSALDEADALVFVDGEGPWAAAKGARALPVADRAVVAVAHGAALAGARVAVVLSGAGRLAAVREVLAASGPVGGALVLIVPAGQQAGPPVDGPLVGAVAGLPSVRVWAVATAEEAREAAAVALRAGGAPTVIGVARVAAPPLDARVGAPEGRPVATVLVSTLEREVVAESAAVLREAGLAVEVVLAASLSPPALGPLASSLGRTGRLVVVGDDPAFADAWCGALFTAADGAGPFYTLEAPPRRAAAAPSALVAAVRAAVATGPWSAQEHA
jgi:hypothetical protein